MDNHGKVDSLALSVRLLPRSCASMPSYRALFWSSHFPASMANVFTDHGWLSARIRPRVVLFETRYPSRSPGIAKLLVRDCTSITLPKLIASGALGTSLGENEA